MPTYPAGVSLVFNTAGFALSRGAEALRGALGYGPGKVAIRRDSLGVLVILDATLQEVITKNSDVTEFPVEEGKSITDHVRPKPVELRLDGIVSDTPLDRGLLDAVLRASNLAAIGSGGGTAAGIASVALDAGGAIRQLLAAGEPRRSVDAYDQLSELYEEGQTVTIVTPFEQFESMVMAELIITRDRETGDALRFAAHFREIVTVDAQTTTVTIPGAKKQLGAKSLDAAPAKTKESNDTALMQIVNSLKSKSPPRSSP